MKKKKTNWISIIAVVVIAAVAGLGYSLYSFYSSGSAERGIVICDPENPSDCLWQDHMHFLVLISAGGADDVQNLPLEKGDLDKPHTHEERNVIHWHSSVPYDPVRQEAIDKSVFTLSASLASIGVEMPDGGKVFVKKKGGSWEYAQNQGGYVWDDSDIIFVTTDSSANEEIVSELEASGISLPYLGAG